MLGKKCWGNLHALQHTSSPTSRQNPEKKIFSDIS